MKNKMPTSRLTITLALTALCLSNWAAADGAETSLSGAFSSLQETAKASKARLKAPRAAMSRDSGIDERIGHKASLKTLFAKQRCSSEFQQVNDREPLATCAVDAGVPGMIRPLAILPFGLDGEFDSEI